MTRSLRQQASAQRWGRAGRATWVGQQRDTRERAAQAAGWPNLAALLADPAVSHRRVAEMLGVSYQYAWRLRRPYRDVHRRRGKDTGPKPRIRPSADRGTYSREVQEYARSLAALLDQGETERLNLSLAAAQDAGWTLRALGDLLGVSREAVRLRISSARQLALPAPPPPQRS